MSLAVLLVLVFFGEILPKVLAAAAPRAISTAAAWPVLVFHRAIGRPAGVLSSPVILLARRVAGRESETEPGMEPGPPKCISTCPSALNIWMISVAASAT